jgi:hypothetical protein
MVKAILFLYGFMAGVPFLITALILSGSIKGKIVCPPDMYIEGVRPDGASSCVTRPPRGCEEPAGARVEREPCHFVERRKPVQLYCTGGMHPIVVDDRTIGCQR